MGRWAKLAKNTKSAGGGIKPPSVAGHIEEESQRVEVRRIDRTNLNFRFLLFSVVHRSPPSSLPLPLLFLALFLSSYFLLLSPYDDIMVLEQMLKTVPMKRVIAMGVG